MPRSCKCILDTMVHKGAMTEKEREKILRNLKGIEWHPYPQEKPTEMVDYLVTIYVPSAMFPDRVIRVAEWCVPFDDEDGEWYFKEYIGEGNVTAWAEMPKPYEEGAEE